MKRLKQTGIWIFLFFFCVSTSVSQDSLLMKKSDFINNNLKNREIQSPPEILTADSASGFLLAVYRMILSSQDKPSCVFIPSCSIYAGQSIEKYGLILGGLMSSDRLQRCHAGAYLMDYPYDADSGRLEDPVK